jgi:hypothetical protein
MRIWLRLWTHQTLEACRDWNDSPFGNLNSSVSSPAPIATAIEQTSRNLATIRCQQQRDENQSRFCFALCCLRQLLRWHTKHLYVNRIGQPTHTLPCVRSRSLSTCNRIWPKFRSRSLTPAQMRSVDSCPPTKIFDESPRRCTVWKFSNQQLMVITGLNQVSLPQECECT